MTEKKDTLEKFLPQGKRETTQQEDVFLDRMDGYQFQKFVGDLFQKLGFFNIKVGPVGADEGIDIKMEQRTNLGTIRYIVECKHYAEGIVGRPVVQKLHSAVITNAMNKGIIVTSGYFSSEAIQSSEDVGIELVDIDKLKALARKVGLLIHEESRLLIDNCFPISGETSIIDSCRSFLRQNLIGFSEDLTRIEDVGLKLSSAYMIDYTIDARFSTSVGQISAIHLNSSAFFDGGGGQLLNPELMEPFIEIKHMLSEIHEKDIKAKLVEKKEFVKSFKDIKEIAIETLRKVNTKTVSYYGKNNVRYTKTCVPNKKDILIREVRRVYLPIWSIGLSILKNKYLIVASETSGALKVFPSRLIDVPKAANFTAYPDNCMVCNNNLESEAHLCNECGAIVCKKDRFDCKTCGKVICRKDMVSKRKYLIFTERYCPRCAQSLGIGPKPASG